jgi:hypothetical protein
MSKTFGQAISAKPMRQSQPLVDWRSRHDSAILAPSAIEAPLVEMLRGWYQYAQIHEAYYGSVLGEDSILGAAWLSMASQFLHMFNGHLGRLDGGVLDRFIRATILAAGFTQEEVDNA